MDKKNQFSYNKVFDTTIRLLFLLLIIVWCLFILYPFANILLWSLILAMALYPIHTNITKRLGGKPKLASFVIVFLAFAIIFIPTWFLTDSLVQEVKELKSNYDTTGFSIPPPTEKVKDWPIIGENVYDLWQSASLNLEQTLGEYQDQLLGIGKKMTKSVISTVSDFFKIMISFILATVLLVFGGTGEGIRKFFRKLLGNRGDEYADVTMKTVSSVLKGVIGVAFIVAILHGILFFLAGVAYPGLLTLAVLVLGVLQLPALLVTLPIVIYLFAVKSTSVAIIWTILMIVAGLSDNILKPILLGKGASVPMPVIFIGVIGGFLFSGFIGLFTGAIVMSLGYKIFIGWINSNEEIKQEG